MSEDIPIYFVLQQGQEKEEGPYSLHDIRERLMDGKLTSSDMYAVSGYDKWDTLGNLLQTKREIMHAREFAGVADVEPKKKEKLDINWRKQQPPVLGGITREPSGHKTFGLVLMLVGFLVLFYFLFLHDIAVGGTINIGLVSNQETGMIFGAVCAIVGAMFYNRRKEG